MWTADSRLIERGRKRLPSSLKIMTHDGSHNSEPIAPGSLPDSLTEFTLGYGHAHQIMEGVLPPSIHRLTFNNNNNLWPDTLPVSLTSLTFMYDSPLLGLGTLPPTLTELSLGRFSNNTLLPGVLPTSLITLTLGQGFMQPLLLGSLPPGLKKLTFGMIYNKPIKEGVLPISLTSLKFGQGYRQRLGPGVLPASITRLSFGKEYIQQLTQVDLPASLTKLTATPATQLLSVPPSLVHLKHFWDVPYSLLQPTPDTIKHLTLGNSFEETITPGMLGDSLTALTLGRLYNQTLEPGGLPHSLLSLRFGFAFTRPLARGTLPPSLTILEFGPVFSQRIAPDTLPDSITKLTFGGSFNSEITPCALPSSLRDLYINIHSILSFKAYFNKTVATDPTRHSVHRLHIELFFNRSFVNVIGLPSVCSVHLPFDDRVVVCRMINQRTVILLDRRIRRGWGFLPVPSLANSHCVDVDKV
ncbi:hypothetical protein SAMD00019534_026520 [Acytostelium subglobosum LB1]|uniref:hypothetical protein n=1 Tax=Acytostelium subglobosum LB1 TaxID=1410327 RepID=UPI0006451E3A|nr:hypothetical protein SAMD00019534_026520 [Acytostelium subglobosum LB1]GAM19477.1 hypothetical protein SAMD00019534_026520 [Acytostelium subglobosum LB1]|eukprot:XP_012757404.1 hypothetical protein SAMD00019534_026520 [Acytostelium subglobosum LB1]